MSLIYVDWGSTRRRAFLFSPKGTLVDQRSDLGGVKNVSADLAAASLKELLADWLAKETSPRLLISGMVTSREGWFPSPSLKLPVPLRDLGKYLYRKQGPPPFGEVVLVPGLSGTTADGSPEFMRGEEIQIYLALAKTGQENACFVLPGTHSKWVAVEQGNVLSFQTFLTGELFALLRQHSLLKSTSQQSLGSSAFDTGLQESLRAEGGPGQLLHLLFRARAKVLAGELEDGELASWLSGLLIGSEVKQGLASGQQMGQQPIYLLGEGHLLTQYQRAFECLGSQVNLLSVGDLVPYVFALAVSAELVQEVPS